MKNFFNAIGVADMEKVHSAMIAWILDDENDNTLSSTNPSQFTTFSKKERSSLLCKLFGVGEKEFKFINTHVEWNDIDIVIETTDANGCEEIWVIENKLKSQEHMSNEKDATGKVVNIWQTTKYENVIEKEFKNYQKHQKHYMLLSLMGDNAKSSSRAWKSYTYEQLLSSLKKTPNLNKYILVKEYVSSIDKMIQELNVFLDPGTNLMRYPHVFSKLKKSEKNSNSNKIFEEERYIVENGLETIFQKQFLAEMWKAYIDNKYIFSNKVWSISETNGTALLDIHLEDIELKGEKHHVQIEFQNGTFKIQFFYQLDGKQAHKSKDNFLEKWKKVFNSDKQYKDENKETWRVNRPKSKSNRSYISISKKTNNCWWKEEKDDLLNQWDENLNKCKTALEKIKEEFINNNK